MVPSAEALAGSGVWTVRQALASRLPHLVRLLQVEHAWWPRSVDGSPSAPAGAAAAAAGAASPGGGGGEAGGEQAARDEQCGRLVDLLVERLAGAEVSHWVRAAAVQAAGATICALPR